MEHIYSCDSPDPLDLVIIHRFPEVDTKIDSLLYFMTINGDKFYNELEETSVFFPNLIRTEKVSEDTYKSTYSVTFSDKIDQEIDYESDDIKLYLVLPFDYRTSIIDMDLTRARHFCGTKN